MSENERIKALQKAYKLDHQYYFNDQDRLNISKLTDFEREDLMMQRMKKIKIQSDKIALLAEIQQKNAKKEEEKVPAVKKTVDVLKDLSGKKVQKSSKTSN